MNIEVIDNKGGKSSDGGTWHSIESQATHHKMKYKYTFITMPKDSKEDCIKELLHSIKIRIIDKILPTPYYIIGKNNILKTPVLWSITKCLTGIIHLA